MTIRQVILRRLYPLFRWVQQMRGKKRVLTNKKNIRPPVPFYSFSLMLNNGLALDFERLRGKKVLLVNTASHCGYTGQYKELQALYNLAAEEVEILAMPANDFKQQEKDSDEEIAQFCERNFGLSFPLAKKLKVSGGAGQHPLYRWLTDPEQNGWNAQKPVWNFCKYLVDENGMLTHYFDPAVSPLSEVMIKAIQQ